MSQTWVSGGSGSGVYDPVTTTDSVHFSDSDDRRLQFRVQGGRIYNFGTYRKSGIKAVCDEIRNRSRPRCLFIVFVATLILILMMLAIAIAASHNGPVVSPEYEKWTNTTNGLMFMPPGADNTVHIHFSLKKTEPDEINRITAVMEKVTSDYQLLKQQTDQFVDCNSTYAPADKVCKQGRASFGRTCTKVSHYGYIHGQPCVLLLLRLPNGMTVRPFRPMDGAVYTEAEKVLGDRFSVDHIGVTCEPATSADKENVHDNSPNGSPIEYSPPKGFPSYVYRDRSIDQFLTPAVMVQFKTIRDFRPTGINCKAWGMAMDSQGKETSLKDHYNTFFVLHIE